jgi:hypothetical protein
MGLVGVTKSLGVSGEEAAGSVRQEHALVRVQCDGVRTFDPRQGGAAARCELEEPAVGAVDMAPQPLLRCYVGDLVERVDHAGVDRAGARDHEERA